MGEIGILTFNRAINYGAVLQAYALKQVISNYSAVEIINYNCPFVEKTYKYFTKNKLERIVKYTLLNKRNKKFYDFISKICTKNIYNKEQEFNFEYEKIIVGSDQVWNYRCSGNDETFLLPNSQTKKYSYAASFGVSELPEEQVMLFRELLSAFRYISVREKTGREICKNQLGLRAEVTLDPTLLLSKEEWLNSFNTLTRNKKYLLIYSLQKDKKLIEAAKKIAKILKLRIYNITANPKNAIWSKVIKSAGPKEWVELFYNAEFIVTDSFHGTAFSVNFNKPFYSFASNERASRIVDLLNMLGLQNRLNPTLEEVNPEIEIDYNSVNEKLEEERKKSITFIEKIIND